jgi:hypothetical protein
LTATTSTQVQQRHARTQRALARGVSSSFHAAAKAMPLCFDHAQGVRVVDVDGLEYRDCALARSPSRLGHGHRAVVDAARAQLEHGHLFGAPHVLETDLAEPLRAAIPCAELVTSSNAGAEAMPLALPPCKERAPPLGAACTDMPDLLPEAAHETLPIEGRVHEKEYVCDQTSNLTGSPSRGDRYTSPPHPGRSQPGLRAPDPSAGDRDHLVVRLGQDLG